MKNLKILNLCFIFSLIYCGCKNDDDISPPVVQEPELTENIEVYNEDLIDNGGELPLIY